MSADPAHVLLGKARDDEHLAELIDLLRSAGIAYPEVLDGSVALTPFAAEMRYDYLPPEQEGEAPFDRAGAMRLVRAALAWARDIVSPSGQEGPGA
jgi:hypothetical protein